MTSEARRGREGCGVVEEAESEAETEAEEDAEEDAEEEAEAEDDIDEARRSAGAMVSAAFEGIEAEASEWARLTRE